MPENNEKTENTAITEEKLTKTDDPQQDIPEEGFVPYAAEAAAEGSPRKKKMLILLSVLGAVLLVTSIIVLPGIIHNFYRSTMKTLRFDCRSGETADTEAKTELGAAAVALAKQTDGHTVKMEAVSYLFDENQELDETVSVYNYTHSAKGNSLRIKSAANGSMFTRKAEYPEKGSSYVPDLYSYCFAVNGSQSVTFSCYDSYRSVVGGKQYTCEIWLMNVHDASGDHYNTLYRYYDSGRLAGVRILLDTDELIEVLDIRDYTIE